MQRDRDYKYNISDPYKGLNYKKGTKNIDKPNIEFEGGEPIFSPKKKDGSRDLIYYSPDGPKHSEGGIPGKVVAKNHYKTKPNSKGAVKMPEGSAIVTAKKDLGKRAVEAHTAGKDDIVEKIISKMPSDKNFKKVGGDRSASLNNKRVTDANDNEDSYDFNDLSPEDYNRLSPLVKTHDDVQKILSAKRAELGHDLSRSEMDSALTGYNTKYGTNYNWNDYNNSVKELSNFNTGRGKTPLNFRGNTEGKTAGAVDDYTGIYGNRNARARIAISQRQATPPSTLPSTTAAPKLTSAARTGYVPIQGPSSTIQDKPTKGGLPYSMRVSDANNIVQGIKGPDIQRLQRYNPTINPYYDLSDPSRRYSRKISSIERANAFNLSGGNAGNARANSMNALGEDANRQQDINNNELGRYDRIREQNVGIQNEANLMNTNIANQEQDINAANRQAARDQFQAGLVGFDENNYRNKITNADYRANQERNNIEKQRLGLLNNYFPNYTNNGGIGVQYRPTGIAGNSVPNTQVNNPLVAGSGRAAQDEEEFSKLAGVLKKGSKSIKKPKYKAKKS